MILLLLITTLSLPTRDARDSREMRRTANNAKDDNVILYIYIYSDDP